MEKAKWIDDNTKLSTFKCSNCGKEPLYKAKEGDKFAYVCLTPYCPFCGASMDIDKF